MSNSISVKVSKRYQIAVPSMARQLLHIKTGDRLLVDVQDGVIVLIPKPKNYAEAMEGLHHEVWESIDVDKYIAEEGGAWEDLPKG
jgi:AbrB family looped-hinge helix DNA binding protein